MTADRYGNRLITRATLGAYCSVIRIRSAPADLILSTVALTSLINVSRSSPRPAAVAPGPQITNAGFASASAAVSFSSRSELGWRGTATTADLTERSGNAAVSRAARRDG